MTLFNIGQEEFRAPLNPIARSWEGIHRMTENKLLRHTDLNMISVEAASDQHPFNVQMAETQRQSFSEI